MIKDSLFDIELTAKDILNDWKKELDYLENAFQISEKLAIQETEKKDQCKFDSYEYNDHREMAMLYKARKAVYKELKERLKEKLEGYIEE